MFCLFVCLSPLQTLKLRSRGHVWFMSALFTFSTILAQSRGPVNIWVQWNQMILCPASEEMKALGPWHSLRNPSEMKNEKLLCCGPGSLKRELDTEGRNNFL